MQALALDGVDLAYEERGSGDPLVLIHGSGGQTEFWEPVFDDFSSRHRVVAYDRRGYGRSNHRPVRDYQLHVADAIELIECVVGGPTVVVGHSSGGNVALALAAERPDLVRALVVAEAPFHGVRYGTVSFFEMVARAKWEQLRRRPTAAAARFFRWGYTYRTGGNAFDRFPAERRELLLRNARPVLAELDPHPRGGTFERLSVRKLSAIGAPITFLLGELTHPWFRRTHAKLIAKVPGIQTEHIPGASHAMIDAPAEFAAAVERGALRAR